MMTRYKYDQVTKCHLESMASFWRNRETENVRDGRAGPAKIARDAAERYESELARADIHISGQPPTVELRTK